MPEVKRQKKKKKVEPGERLLGSALPACCAAFSLSTGHNKWFIDSSCLRVAGGKNLRASDSGEQSDVPLDYHPLQLMTIFQLMHYTTSHISSSHFKKNHLCIDVDWKESTLTLQFLQFWRKAGRLFLFPLAASQETLQLVAFVAIVDTPPSWRQRSLTIRVSEVKTAAAVFYNPESLLSFLGVLPFLKKQQFRCRVQQSPVASPVTEWKITIRGQDDTEK